MYSASNNVAKAALVIALLGAVSPAALAQTNNFVLENLSVAGKTKGTTLFKRIEVTGSSLSKDELTKLFTGANKEEAAALARKLKADKIIIPEARFTEADSVVTFRDFQATGVNEGKIANAVLKSVEGKGKANGGEIAFKSGALELQGLAFANVLAAASGGDIADGTARIGKLTWAGFEMTAPDEEMKSAAPGTNLYRISLASLTAESTYDGDIPLKGKAEAKNFVVEPPKGSKFGQALASFGYAKIDMGLLASGEYDKARKTYNLDNLTFTGVNAGAIGLKALFGALDPSTFTGTKEQKMSGWFGSDIATMSIRYANNGLFEKAVDFVAKQQKKAPDALKKEWSGMVTQFLPLLLGGDPAALKLADAGAKFIAAPKSLTISVKPRGAPLKLADLMKLRDPQAFLALVEIDAVSGQ